MATVASSWSRATPARRWPRRPRKAALTLLDAGPAPAGAMPVVVGNGFGGVLFHEMTGHGLEADHIQKGASVYAGKLGEDIAPPFLRAYDDGRLPGEWGTEGIDDEGTPTQATALIHEGRVTSYLYDLHAGAQGRRRLDRQRPPRVVSPPADPADDQHLHRAGRGDARGADRGGRARLLRGFVRRRPGRPDDRRLRLRRLGGLPDRGRQGDHAVSRRDPDRQLPDRAAQDRRRRRRLRDQDRLLRQGRPAGAGRRRPGTRPDRAR